MYVGGWEGSFRRRWGPWLHDVVPREGLIGLAVLTVPVLSRWAVLACMAHDADSASQAFILSQDLTGGAALLVLRGAGDGS